MLPYGAVPHQQAGHRPGQPKPRADVARSARYQLDNRCRGRTAWSQVGRIRSEGGVRQPRRRQPGPSVLQQHRATQAQPRRRPPPRPELHMAVVTRMRVDPRTRGHIERQPQNAARFARSADSRSAASPAKSTDTSTTQPSGNSTGLDKDTRFNGRLEALCATPSDSATSSTTAGAHSCTAEHSTQWSMNSRITKSH